MKRFFTSESVTEGHPDKICDQISDAILDAILSEDPNARVACETSVTTGLVLVAGEITTNIYVDIQKVVRDTVKGIGYDRGKYGFDAENLAVLVAIDPQSPDIAQGVNVGEGTYQSQGAGDQGLMFGYASNETKEYMPIAITYAHKLAMQLSKVRKDGTLKFLRPDGKTQVTFNLQTGYSEATKRLAMLNSTQYAELMIEGAKYNDDADGTPYDDPYSWVNYAKNDLMDYYSYGEWSKDPAKTYDWQDRVFQKGHYRQADLQIRGGNDKTKFFSSMQHLEQGGTIIGNELTRTTGRLNVDQQANNWLDLGLSLIHI